MSGYSIIRNPDIEVRTIGNKWAARNDRVPAPAFAQDDGNHYNSPNRRWRKEASMARIHFLEVFPFLPENEMPANGH